MKNYESTRSKIKLYLNAIKDRFSTSEWKEYHAKEICGEFGITVTLPQILKNEGYYHYEHKNGVPSMMLSEKIMMLNEVTAHNKIREYCNLSKQRLAIKQLQKKQKNKKKPSKKEGFVVFSGDLGPEGESLKNIGTKVSRGIYNELVADCKRKGMTLKEYFSSIVQNSLENQTPPPPAKRGRPFSNPQVMNQIPTEIEGAYYPKTTTFKQVDFPVVTSGLPKEESKVEDAETKIKSLESIMNLFLKGIINAEELESLKKGILNK